MVEDSVRSRCLCAHFPPPGADCVYEVLRGVLRRSGVAGRPSDWDKSARAVASVCGGDIRRAITDLESVCTRFADAPPKRCRDVYAFLDLPSPHEVRQALLKSEMKDCLKGLHGLHESGLSVRDILQEMSRQLAGRPDEQGCVHVALARAHSDGLATAVQLSAAVARIYATRRRKKK